MKLLSYDVETASYDRGSICAVGWVQLDDDIEIARGYTLINPRCKFCDDMINVHGIHEDDVASAPTFGEYWDSTLAEIMSSSVIVAHNAIFDMSATEQALKYCGITDPGIDYLDSIAITRSYYDLPSYSLPELMKQLGHEYNAHNALEDADAVVVLLRGLCKLTRCPNINYLIAMSGVEIENTLTNNYIPKDAPKIRQAPSYNAGRCRDVVDAVDTKLSGLKFCLTGDMLCMSRPDCEREIRKHGGLPMTSVSKRTDYLVLGSLESFGADYHSTKLKRAEELLQQGCKIQIISPEDLLRMMDE